MIDKHDSIGELEGLTIEHLDQITDNAAFYIVFEIKTSQPLDEVNNTGHTGESSRNSAVDIGLGGKRMENIKIEWFDGRIDMFYRTELFKQVET